MATAGPVLKGNQWHASHTKTLEPVYLQNLQIADTNKEAAEQVLSNQSSR